MDSDKVLEALKKSDKPMKSGEIAAAIGMEKAAVDKAIAALKKEGKITSPVRCCYAAA